MLTDTKIVEAYQTVLEAKRLADLERQKEEIENLGGVAVPLFDDKGHLSAYVSEYKKDKQETAETATSILTTEAKSETSKSSQIVSSVDQAVKVNRLPKTNSQNSWWLSLLGLLTLTNLVIFKTKKENAHD